MKTRRFCENNDKHPTDGGDASACAFSARPTISVIVPVYNGGENFRRCLTSLTAAVPQADELIVVADGDTDGSWQLASRYGARVIRTTGPSGPAHARNRGACLAQGEILFFVDADVIIPEGIIGQVRAIFREDPQLDAIFGSYDDAPGATNFLGQYKNLLNHYVHQTARENASTFWSACGAIRREVFLAIGGFDENYITIEDIELGYRLKQAGYRVRLCKALQVKHLKRWEANSLLWEDFWRRAVPWTELILRDRHMPNDLNVRLSGRMSVLLVYGLLVLLTVALQWPSTLWGVVALALILLLVNAPFYRFLWQKRGFLFTIHAIPWHWFYYLYSGLAFVLGVVRHLIRGGRRRPARLLTGFAGRPAAGNLPE